MALDPDVARYLEASVALGFGPYEDLDPPAARAQYLEIVALRRGPDYVAEPVAAVEDRAADGVPVRVYTPLARTPGEQQPAPVVVLFHGGGFVIGDLESHDGIGRAIANGVGAVVVSVDYRRSPEHRHPAPIDDCWTATRWVAAPRGGAGRRPGAPRRRG